MVRTPGTPASKITRTPATTPGGQKSHDEKIFVTVRVRPLSRKEQALKDQVAWGFKDENTIFLKSVTDRSSGPYIFDRVFDPSCVTEKVYDEGAKDVALSALTGINATIFAYGQTSSGKTFTMRGITEHVVKDIFEHISRTPEREFSLKFSALEIYNETVIDLLNWHSDPLRLLDDPEKGIVVEKQTEEVAKDCQHLRNLIGNCEAQRQVAETALNDTSSRSHQIIKLTVESSLRECSGHVKSYIASLNLVDLAGSERALQTNVDGVRLKEGSHINRSLLTLTKVIRKLSEEKRSGHIPYRESKLTRILQPSLGGNSRTAIICTMSPAVSHVEQSRNTLLFAMCAKEVTNSAKVNVVVAEKQLVKHLQNEVARLEAELRSPEPSSLCLRSQLVKKDLEIQQMKMELEELKRQRDRVQSELGMEVEELKQQRDRVQSEFEMEVEELKRQRDRVQSELEMERKLHKKQKGAYPLDNSHRVAKCLPFSTENVSDISMPIALKGQRNKVGRNRRSLTSTDRSLLYYEVLKLEQKQKQIGEEANRALEVFVDRFGSQDAAQTVAKFLAEIKEKQINGSLSEVELRDNTNFKDEIAVLNSQGKTFAILQEKLDNVQKSINMLMMCLPSNMETSQGDTPSWKKKILPSPLRNNTNMQHMIRSPCSPTPSANIDVEQENKTPQGDKYVSAHDTLQHSCKATPPKNGDSHGKLSMFIYVAELKERIAKLQYQKDLLMNQVVKLEENESSGCEIEAPEESPMSWSSRFEKERMQIIMLWHLCHVSIVHRTQFFLLFKGDPDDQVYMEVERRRLTWLEQQLAEVGNASPALLGDEPAGSVTSCIRALKQEREQLAKRASSRLTPQELEMMYIKWEVPSGGKQRRLQLVNKHWTDPFNLEHVKESATVVAKLVGFCELKENPLKEMFQLNFVSPSDEKSWMGWNLMSNLLNR